MSYIESLEKSGVTVPECYKNFRNSAEFDGLSGMIPTELDREIYDATTEIYFDWDDYMLEELFDPDIAEYIPVAILHYTEIIDDAYLAIRADDPDCTVYYCEIDENTSEITYDVFAKSLVELAESLAFPEENYIEYLEKKFNTALPERYKQFLQSYEYEEYNGKTTVNESEVIFNEFPNLQWAAENFNKETLEWLPLASMGDDITEYNDIIAIKMGDENCPVYFLNGDETELLSNSLNEFIQ